MPEWLSTSLGVTLLTGLRYFAFAGTGYLLGYVWFRRRWFHRKIVAAFPPPGEARRELLYSLRTLLVFGATGATTHMAIKSGLGRMYFKVGDYGWGWYVASIALAIVLHDTYFYWTHRLMHHRRLFRVFHRAHHTSVNPTPWAAYAFSVPEAVVQAGIFPLTVLLIPIHPSAFLIFMTWQITFNVIGHTGYELYPRRLMDSWLGCVLNTPTNHAMHHEHFRGNYGLYFNVWDRLMGTNHEDYERRFREVTSRPQSSGERADNPAPAAPGMMEQA